MDGTNGQPVLEEPVLRIDRNGESTIVYLTGELDLLVSPDLQRLLDTECEQSPRRLRLDLTVSTSSTPQPYGCSSTRTSGSPAKCSPRARQLHAGDPPTALADEPRLAPSHVSVIPLAAHGVCVSGNGANHGRYCG